MLHYNSLPTSWEHKNEGHYKRETNLTMEKLRCRWLVDMKRRNNKIGVEQRTEVFAAQIDSVRLMA